MPKRKILIADNNEGFLNELASYLKSEGYSVVTAKNLDEAKKVIGKKYDAAILDIRLRKDRDEKDISGLMLAEMVSSGTPVIFLTKFPTVEKVRRALAPKRKSVACAFDFIVKKEADDHLLPAIRDAIFLKDLQKGDEAAWKQLWKEEAPGVIALCRRHGLTQSEALDVWPRIFKQLPSAPIFALKKPTLRKWLINEAILQMGAYLPKERISKSSLSDPTGEILLNEQLLADMGAAAVGSKVSRDKLIRKVSQTIEKLGPRQGKVMMLYTFQGASKAKIAKQLGITEKDVVRHLREGSRRIRESISSLREE